MLDMAHGRFKQGLRRGFTVFFLQVFFQRPGIDADTNRNVFVARAVNHGANTLFATDVTWVNTQAVHAILRHFERNTVIKVDIRDQRNVDLLLDEFKGFSRIHSRYGYAHDICANALKRFNLIDCRFHIGGASVGH